MTPTKTKGSITARLEHLNTNEAEENDLKNHFRSMFEDFKKEMKNSLKEMEGAGEMA